MRRIELDGVSYLFVLTNHGIQRLTQRCIAVNHILDTIKASSKVINQYHNSSIDIMVVDKRHNYSLIIAVDKKRIKIVTAINKISGYFVKDNTIVYVIPAIAA